MIDVAEPSVDYSLSLYQRAHEVAAGVVEARDLAGVAVRDWELLASAYAPGAAFAIFRLMVLEQNSFVTLFTASAIVSAATVEKLNMPEF